MKDTSPQMEEKMREMIRRKSPEERFKMGCSMYDFSKELVIHAIRESNPGISPAALKRELFLRFYGNDFTPAALAKILERFS